MKTIGMGIMITFLYDFILISRQVIRHSMAGVSLEDLMFWIFCAGAVFYLLYEENNGILRWFAVVGAAVGMMIYKKLIGMHFVLFVSRIMKRQCLLVSRITRYLFAPFHRGAAGVKRWGSRYRSKGRHLEKMMKKKLTDTRRMLKITISKH